MSQSEHCKGVDDIVYIQYSQCHDLDTIPLLTLFWEKLRRRTNQRQKDNDKLYGNLQKVNKYNDEHVGTKLNSKGSLLVPYTISF